MTTQSQSSVTAISRCRISGSTHLVPVLSLGEQYLTGVFPRSVGTQITKGPLELVWCPDSGLLQLRHSYSLSEMYGENYGYRSGLNASMVAHLSGIVRGLERRRPLDAGDIVLDIGSNDGTLLKSYATRGIRRVGIDPTAGKFREFYTSEIEVVCDFFSAEAFRSVCGASRARVITSIAMFYDLEDPGAFVDQVRSVLADDGLWHFEQSYMPSMLRTNAYDTVCHEHLEYYSLRVINELLESRGMRIIGATMNSTNGGSVAVTACHRDASFVSEGALIDWMLEQEDHWGLHTPAPYRHFEERVFKHRADLRRLVDRLVDSGKRVLGYGASTKGNVLLQLCGFGPTQIPAIAEVNPSKFGSYTPGTLIPILPEAEVRSMRPDYLLVLPWHFKHSIIERERDYLAAGGRLIFPLPEIEIVGD